MNENIPDKKAYQSNRRKMCYIALALMGITTISCIIQPDKMKEIDSILMTQYLALSGLVGAYFGFARK
tara:strand:- start:36 stop:239 length:204 start_codon:yes stop_codon:yes gene_type:complete